MQTPAIPSPPRRKYLGEMGKHVLEGGMREDKLNGGKGGAKDNGRQKSRKAKKQGDEVPMREKGKKKGQAFRVLRMIYDTRVTRDKKAEGRTRVCLCVRVCLCMCVHVSAYLDRAPATRPPSRVPMGMRLKRLIMRPKSARAYRIWESKYIPPAMMPRAPKLRGRRQGLAYEVVFSLSSILRTTRLSKFMRVSAPAKVGTRQCNQRFIIRVTRVLFHRHLWKMARE
jgi:hypothetical protein